MHPLPMSILSLLLMASVVGAQYTLQKDYFQTNFFNSFDFFDGADPTNGFVQYTGQDNSLISSSGNNAQMHVSTAPNTPNGRPSIRITSKDSYETGLIILDLEHMPGGICGTWPAFWTFGPDWPTDGEIDIIEGVNDVQTNQVTLHTGSTCSISPSNMVGSISTDNCDVSSGDNTGCGITTSNTATYGSAFNDNGGGVYATLLTNFNIIVWFFPRDSIPSDVLSDSPTPSTWSTPLANFSGPSCNFGQEFTSQNIVFDTTFCGDWAGQTWSTSGCAAKAATCNDYVANNGADFEQAYWSINGLKVFQSSGASQSSAPASLPPASSTSSLSTSSVLASVSLTTSEATSSVPVASTSLSTSSILLPAASTTLSTSRTVLSVASPAASITVTTSSTFLAAASATLSTSSILTPAIPSSVTLTSSPPTTFLTVTTPAGMISSALDSTWTSAPTSSAQWGPGGFGNNPMRSAPGSGFPGGPPQEGSGTGWWG